jgi:hypothetical protein
MLPDRIDYKELAQEVTVKVEDLIAELAVFPLNDKVHIKVDGQVRYITRVKINEETSSDDVILVEVV